MSPLRSETGQTAVISIVFLTVLLGMAAVTLDFGSWYRADRAAQSAADAAALAGAQALPEDTALARSLALAYAEENEVTLDPAAVSFDTELMENDTITVELDQETPGFFSKLFGVETVKVAARAAARAANPAEARWVAPIVVNEQHPDLRALGRPTTIELANLHRPGSSDAAGAFGLINLRRDDNGSVGASELSSWMERGYDQAMPTGSYHSVPSAMFNSSQFRDALQLRMGDDVLFPIYRLIVRGGATAQYDVVAWVGFHVTGRTGGGDQGQVEGWFTRIIAGGLPATTPSTPNFGVRVISLVE